jgi:glutamate racemase
MDRAVEEMLSPLCDKGIRTLILGCTHYPFIAPAISAYMGGGIRLVDPAVQLASIISGDLHRDAMFHGCDGSSYGGRVYWCSGDTEAFRAVGGNLLGHMLEDVRKQVF